ncbi:putative LPS assembly protein LptD [Hymenobacter sp. GOD-10R]|uniref:putative LPS assembly protein LptD n=1 Tax=Hymenobacter sp. GOD-10R TaxID=3093922 RepID=UPI002D78CBA7|nr:putative LPS assembly protein LptD [Hymenobacter sp. GOD-10R]WRQ29710.1 putative LPS assembly protein LptD [Hymenobacter sp. GOD-10R]
MSALFSPSTFRHLPHVLRLATMLPLLLVWLGLPFTAQGQQRPQEATVPAAVPRLGPDGRAGIPLPNNNTSRGGTVIVADTARTADSLRVTPRKGALETTVKYVAKDSIRFEVQSKKAYLYNKADVNYGKMDLKADLITVDYGTNVVKAEGIADSTGKVRGKPVFNNEGGVYSAGVINYNFKTKKGKIAEAITNEGEGYIHAETIKKNALNEMYGRNGRYTTCNLEHPHFYINATKMKVIPGEKVVTGPFNLVIGDIPTPLGFLFGYFPMTSSRGRASGVIIPTFGSTTDRGFFLRNGGYYWAANDYIGVRLTGDIYSGNAEAFGGFGLTGEMQYIKRYAYSGRLSLQYSQRPPSQIISSNTASTDAAYRKPRSPKTIWINWSHSPVQKPGGGRFSASVQAGSNDYNTQNSFDARRYLTPAFSSSVSYQKQIRNSPVNYAINFSQSQNTTTGSMTFVLPDITVGVARQYPYEWLGITPRGRFYEQFSIAYTGNAKNNVSNYEAPRSLNSLPLIGGTTAGRYIPFDLSNLSTILRNSQSGIQHQFQISLGSYTVLKHLSFTPNVNYSSTWYNKRLEYSYVEAARAIRVDTLRKFSPISNFSAGASLGTTIYGILPIKGKKVEAIRHKITPSLSYSFSPDVYRNSNYYNTDVLLDYYRALGAQQIINPTSASYAISNYNGFAFGQPGGARVSQISFSLQNSLEMKVRDTQDTTGTNPFKKVSLLDGLDFGTGYNFAADSLNLAPLSAVFRTQIARKLNININGTFEFYQRDSSGTLINKYLFEQRRVARLSSASIQLSYQFNPAAKPKKKSNVAREVAPTNDPVLGAPQQADPYEDYVDFLIPWELSTSFGASYTDPGPRASRLTVLNRYLRPIPVTVAALNVSGSVKLTENFRLGYSSGYDFKNKTVTFTSLDFYRDLHCWQISGNWRPFGYTRGYNVTIAAKSSLLQDLKLNRNRSFLNR